MGRVCNVVAPYIALSVIPFLTVITGVKIRNVSTPYYLLNYDPDYAYLFNSLSILSFLAPEYIDHPGTPVQLLGALILKLMHPFEGSEQIIYEVIEDPERHLLLISNVFIGLNSIALFVAGAILFRLTGRIGLSLLVQLSPLMFPITLMSLGRVTPEPLLLFTSSIFVCLLILLSKFAHGKHEERLAKAFGWAAGFGVTTKLTFIPMIFLPLTVLGSKLLRKTYALYFFVAAFVFTSVFVLYPKLYFYFLRWFFNLSLGSGIYGQGDRTIINPEHYLADLLRISLDQPMYLMTILLATGLYILLRRTAEENKANLIFKPSLLLGLIVIHLISLFVVAKHPQSIRYLIPSLGLSGITLVVSILGFESLLSLNRTKRLLFQMSGVAIGLAAIIFSVHQAMGTFNKLEERGRIFIAGIEKRNRLVEEQYSHCAQVHQDSATQTFALFFGLQWSRQSDATREQFGRRLLMKQAFSYDPGRQIYYTMKGDKIGIDRIRQEFPCVIKLTYSTNLERI